jgi:tetrahedral aminopeptidase
MPNIGNTQLKLLEKLCLAVGVSGDEGEVRKIVREELKSLGLDHKIDALGNVLVIKQGTAKDRLRVMLDCHMDEVGFMIVSEEGDGLYRFETVGGIDVRQLPGKQVVVGKSKTPGVIGARPIHLTTAEERTRKIPLDQLRIDLGPGGKAKVGDWASFAPYFKRVGPSIMAKSIDNRIGVATLLEMLKNDYPNIDLCVSFSVQEEIGLRGAKVAAYHFDPQVAFAIDSTPANDLPHYDGQDNAFYNTKLGLGPAIYTFDAGTLNDPRLIRLLAQVSDANKITYQFRQPGGGGTDGGAIHRVRAGVPTVSVSVPHRYTHSAISVSRVDDWKHTINLLDAALKAITRALVAAERA